MSKSMVVASLSVAALVAVARMPATLATASIALALACVLAAALVPLTREVLDAAFD